MSNSGAMVLPDKIDHIGVVVKDVAETIKFLSSMWGLGPWKILDFAQNEHQVMVGEPVKLKVAYAKLGPTVLELLQPLTEASLWSNVLDTTGGGLHHIAFSLSNWDEMVSRLREEGAEMVAGGHFEGKRWCYFKTTPGGIVVELMDNFGVSI